MSGKVSGTLKALHEMKQEQQRMRERLDDMHEQGVRLANEVTAVAGTLVQIRDLLRDRLDLRDEVRDHERRIAALERRTG